MARSTWRFVSCHMMAGCNHRFISCHGVVRSGSPTVYDGYVVWTLLIFYNYLILMVMVHFMVILLHDDYTCFMIGLCCVQFRL